MPENIKVNVHHVTRVEGHGNIVVDVRDGTLEKCELQIVETPRFFELTTQVREALRGVEHGQGAAPSPRVAERSVGY